MGGEIVSPKADRQLNDGDILSLGNEKITVMHTPGHTPGGIVLEINNIIFSGDTIFRGSVR